MGHEQIERPVPIEIGDVHREWIVHETHARLHREAGVARQQHLQVEAWSRLVRAHHDEIRTAISIQIRDLGVINVAQRSKGPGVLEAPGAIAVVQLRDNWLGIGPVVVHRNHDRVEAAVGVDVAGTPGHERAGSRAAVVQRHQRAVVEYHAARAKNVRRVVAIEVADFDERAVGLGAGQQPGLPERTGRRSDDVDQHARGVAVFVGSRQIGVAVQVEIAGNHVSRAIPRGIRDGSSKPTRVIRPGDVNGEGVRGAIGGDEIEPAVLVEVDGFDSARRHAGGEHAVVAESACPYRETPPGCSMRSTLRRCPSCRPC